jgi:hypothetical protein
VSDSSSRTDSSDNTHDSHEEEPFEPQGTKDSLVQGKDMIEIAMSLRQISDVLESRTINHRSAGATTQESDFWLDDDYLYVDIEYPESDELMMDICVHRGRAFIRVEREGLGIGLIEVPAQGLRA